MTPQDHRTLVARWLKRAQDDLECAEASSELEEVPAGSICALAQHAAEKAIKAILVQVQIDFPKRHDLGTIAALLPPDWGIEVSAETLAGLSAWAIEARYPGDWEDPTPEDAAEALNAAITVWDAVLSQFERHDIEV